MKKIIIVFVLILSSCGIEYDGETKLVIKGKVVDSNNNPIINNEVNLYILSYGFEKQYTENEGHNIGKSITNSNGEYTIVIPKPTNNYSEIIVETNSNDNEFNQKRFRNIQISNFINYELNLPTTILYNKMDLTTLNIIPNNVNPNNELKNIELLGIIPNENEFINLLENNGFYNDFVRLVKKNQTIILRYTVVNLTTNTTSTIDENIVIDNSNQIDYTLNY